MWIVEEGRKKEERKRGEERRGRVVRERDGMRQNGHGGGSGNKKKNILFFSTLPWCFHLDMPRNKSRGTKPRGATRPPSADNACNFYQLSISQFEIIAV